MNRLDLIVNGNQIRAIDLHAKPQVGFRYYSEYHKGELEIVRIPYSDTFNYHFKWLSGVHEGKSDGAGKEFFLATYIRRVK